MYAKVGSRKKGEASLHSPKVERVRYPRRLPLSSFLLAFDRGILSRNLQIANITEMAFPCGNTFLPDLDSANFLSYLPVNHSFCIYSLAYKASASQNVYPTLFDNNIPLILLIDLCNHTCHGPSASRQRSSYRKSSH